LQQPVFCILFGTKETALSATVPVQLLRPGVYTKYKPVVGSMLVVVLPGETMRVPIQTIIDSDTVIVKIDTVPMSRSHTFRINDHVGVRRRVQDNRDVWEAQKDREFLAEQARLIALSPPPPAPPKKVQVAAVVPPIVVPPIVVPPTKSAKKPAPRKQAASKRIGKGKKRRAA
jgi:hypothetical protein